MTAAGPHYKIKLASGRILGPLDAERVRQLILKNQIVGTEVAREYPSGEWVDISLIPTLAELLVARADGKLELKSTVGAVDPLAATAVLPGAEANTGVLDRGPLQEIKTSVAVETEDDRTMVVPQAELEEEKTTVAPIEERSVPELSMANSAMMVSEDAKSIVFEGAQGNAKRIAEEKTVMFQRPSDSTSISTASGDRKKKPSKAFEIIKKLAIVAAVLMAAQELFFNDGAKKEIVKWQAIRPALPEYIKGDPKPEESNKLYAEAMLEYVKDNVTGYKAAADKLRMACAKDIGNVKALAMLASAYINLIDSSNKDENYFSVISKLIEMSRAKNVELGETVIADVEFFITINKAEAAQNRVVEYTKTHQFALEMYYYLALAFYHRGEYQTAAKYIGAIPDNRAFSAKVFYLRGLTAEKLGDAGSAFQEYEKAIKLSATHVKSRLKISELLNKKGNLKSAAPHLDYLVTHPLMLAPKDLAYSYFLHGQLSQLFGKFDVALGDMERAVRLDRDSHEYQLELYTLRAKAGDSTIKGVQKEARMYYFLSEGEKLLTVQNYHEALVQYLQANESNPNSSLPLVKIGDMFRLQNDLNNARVNYKKAAEKAPNNIEVWSKYISVLIQSYEWEEATKAMDKFRNLPVSQSAIDKAAADMYAKQNLHAQAQMYYKKAMARDSVDPDVYIAYARSLMASLNFKEAPFFFALALRFDPLNVDAIIGTAKCIAASDSIDRAISMLQDELSKSNHARSDLLSAIAELYIQKGDWEQAQNYVEQSKSADPNYAYAWKLQAQVYMNREGADKNALTKALDSYESYSQRNPSDPSGYLERYNIYLRRLEFEKASEELAKIYAVFPKYPKLHFFKGFMYSAQGNHKLSAQEYKNELENNPNHVATIIALGKEMTELGVIDGKDGAQELFTKAMQLAPTNPEAKQQAAYASYLLKNYQAAVALYNAALVYDKANPMIFKRLGMAYREMGDHQGAARSFKKYLEMEPDAADKAEFERFR